MRVLAVDPGETTGWALWRGGEEGVATFRNGAVVWGQIGPARGREGEIEAVGHLVRKVSDGDIVVVEDFILRPTGNARRSGLSPVRITARLETLCAARGLDVEWVYQQASAAKGVVTDTRLRDLGLWVRGQVHARDALRHLVLYLRSCRIPIG